MYSIHPHHLNVKLPKDALDDDLVLGQEASSTNEPQPTGMSYALERLRLAFLCREMADTIPLNTAKLMQIPYEQIMALDGKLQDYLSSLPYFFKSDVESLEKSRLLETVYPRIRVSRYCITIEAHSRRFKLHQRFLLRQSVNPRYAYSRRACLESARAVVNSYKCLRAYDSASTAPELMGIAIHFTHLALVVMAMDLCFNKDEAEELEVKAEVKATLQLFEDSQNTSPLLGRFVESLKNVLLAHDVHLTNDTALSSNNISRSTGVIRSGALEIPLSIDQMQSVQVDIDTQYPNFAPEFSFDEFWQVAMQHEQNSDVLAWDNLFSAIDSQPS